MTKHWSIKIGGVAKLAAVLCAAGLAAEALAQQSLDDLLKRGVVVPSNGHGQAPTPAQPAPAQQTRPQAAPARPGAQSGAGFHMNLPPGWSAQLSQSGVVMARSGDGASAVVVAPVLGMANTAPADWLRQHGSAAMGAFLKNAAVSAVYTSQSSRNSALASLDYAGPGGPGTAHVLFFIAGNVGTLYAVAAPKPAFAQQSGALMGILKSFSFSGERTAGGSRESGAQDAAPNAAFTKFADPREGSFTLDVPSGWKVEGGLLRKSTIDVRSFVFATSPDGAMVVRIGDPEIGPFTLPNQMLAIAGLREGQVYTPGFGNSMVISRYLPGPQFAQQYAGKLARVLQASALQFKSVKPRPEFNSVINGGAGMNSRAIAGEASFSCTRNGRESSGTVVAVTRLTTMQGTQTAIWNVEALVDFVAPADQAGAADRIMNHMVQSFRVNEQWAQRQAQTTMETSRIVTETNEHISKIINDTYWATQKSHDRTARNFDDTIRGVVRLRDPENGEELEGVAGKNYYYRVPNSDHTVGRDREIQNPDFHLLEQVH